MDTIDFVEKQVRSIAYASAAGSLVIGGASVDLVNADPYTIIYMVIAAVGFNTIKESTKVWRKKKETK